MSMYTGSLKVNCEKKDSRLIVLIRIDLNNKEVWFEKMEDRVNIVLRNKRNLLLSKSQNLETLKNRDKEIKSRVGTTNFKSDGIVNSGDM